MGTLRWCEKHKQFHGPLYICNTYPEELKKELEEKGNKFRKNLMNEKYIQKMVKKGTSPEVIKVIKLFSGI